MALAALTLGGAFAIVALLTSLGSAAEGPMAAGFTRLASAVDSIEHRVRERLSGRGRGRALAWFEAYRQRPDSLRRPDVLLVGAYDGGLPATLTGVVELEKGLDTTFPLVQLYTAWGDQPEHQFPLRILTSIWNMGSVPVVTWEPWLAAFDNVRHPFLPLREQRDPHGLAAVARGDYDFYVDAWAAEAARFGRPFFLRFAHEMNDPYRYPWGPQHNSKEEFVAAWRHVVERFRRAGAGNVIWVWSPHVARAYWELYYPGNDYVDWTATGALNFGPIAYWSRWWTFREIFGTHYPVLAAFGKPIMIAEFGSLGVGGDRLAWYRDALAALPIDHPQVRALLFFHAARDRTVTAQEVDWSFDDAPGLVDIIRAALNK
jgi:hypothetical protein